MGFKELLAAEFAPFGNLTGDQLDTLERHYKLLVHWNRRMNLTRIEKLEDAVRLHYCESLFVATKLPPGTLRIADIGSGAGFPGIPLAVLRPESSVDLVESHQRKAVFLREAMSGLKNVRVISDRAESVEAEYDWTVSRAVTPSEVLSLAIAPKVAILMSANDLDSLGHKSISVESVPWTAGHVLAMFHVEPS